MEVVGEAQDARGAVEMATRLSPDVVVLDVHLPDGTGIEAARRILASRPSTHIIMFSDSADPGAAREALAAGVSGHLVKTNAAEEVVRAVRAVSNGKLFLCSHTVAALARERPRERASGAAAGQPALSDRDKQLLQLIAQGSRNKEIAAQTGLSTRSVETYRSRLMKKLNCPSTAELVRYAIRSGLTAP